MKKILSLLLIMAMCLTIIPPSAASAAVKLNKTVLTLNVGDTYKLKLSGSTGTIKWSSSDEEIAEVSSKGKVTAKTVGLVVITAKNKKQEYYCALNVVNPLEKSSLKGLVDYLKSFELLKGEEKQMTADMIGAIYGVKYRSVELYEFDMDSKAYKSIVKTNKIVLKDFDMDFDIDGINKQFIILCGGAENTEEILEKFNNYVQE